MRMLSRLVSLRHRLGLATLLCTAAALGATPPPAEVFGALPHISEATLSPSGNMLAWVQADGVPPQIVMYDLAAQKVKRVVSAGKVTKTRRLEWLDDDTLLMEVSATLDVPDPQRDRWEFWRWMAVDAGGGDVRLLLGQGTGFGITSATGLLSVNAVKPKTVYMSMMTFVATAYDQGTGSHLTGHRQDGWLPTLFEVDTVTGKGSVIDRGTAYTQDWTLDRNGRVIARDEWYPEQKEYRLVIPDGFGSREVLKQSGERLYSIVPTADLKGVIVLGRRGESHSKLWNVPLDGSTPTVMMEDAGHDVTGVRYDSATLMPLEVWTTGTESKWLDKPMQSRFAAAAHAFPGQQVQTYEESRDHGRALLLVGSPSRAPVNYIIDFTTHKATIIGEEYPALSGVTLGEVSRIEYLARDGTSITAFQTLPPASSGKNLPLVVLPHGGPHANDRYEFDWLVQFLATRGYAVLQPQFRGSTGYGYAFEHAGDHQWGGLMQDDVTDGVKALIDRGVADPRRVCIVGASYGGYAALAGATFTPDLYACAVSIGGVSDLPGMLAFESRVHGEDSDAVAAWKEDIGSMHEDAVVAKSPARAAAAVRAPILLMHGVDDTVVPIAQSQLMDRALKSNGKTSVFVKLPNEDHWLSRAETRVRVLKELEAFLAANLKPQ
jgi:pimeloyl-ACP methyl ester carboxylesterase